MVTVVYHFWRHERQTIGELMEKSKVTKERLQQSLEQPTNEMVDEHELMEHADIKPRCKHCVGGRSGGERHERVVLADERVFEDEYTYYSQLGYKKNSLARIAEGQDVPGAT